MRREAFNYLYGDDMEDIASAAARKRGEIEPPVCEEEAMWRAATIAEEAAQRDERLAARRIEERADARARCTTDHAKRLSRAAYQWRIAIGEARRDGFDVTHRDEISELMSRQVVKLRDQQSQTMEGDA